MNKIKCVIIGDGGCGKFYMMESFVNICPVDYFSRLIQLRTANMIINEVEYAMEIWSTPGQSGYENMRSLCYPNTDVFIICVAISDPEALKGLQNFWLPELNKNEHKNTPFILVGTQADLRENNFAEKELLTYEECEKAAEKIGAVNYFECSAKTGIGLKEVFEGAILATTQSRKKKNSCKVS